MDSLRNPFSPGVGFPPPELAGRKEILDKAMLALARIRRGRAEKSLILVGLRGVGKTVLLHRISEMAERDGYHALMIEAQEGKNLPQLLIPYLRTLLYSLDSEKALSSKVKRALRVLKSFSMHVKPDGEIGFGVDLDPERGVADSGDLEADLTQLFVALGEAARDRGAAIAVIVDEMQYLSETELGSLIMAVHKISQKSLPLILIGAGLPQLRGKAGNAKSYAERLFEYPEVGQLSEVDAAIAIQEPVREEGVKFTDDALRKVLQITQRYPYFLQEWGYNSWELATDSPIDGKIVRSATDESIARLDKNFFRVRFDRLTPREREYLRAMAELGEGTHRSGDIAAKLGKEVQSVAPLRNNLIRKGMIYSPAHGDTEFTVPLFGEFMKRIMPNYPVR